MTKTTEIEGDATVGRNVYAGGDARVSGNGVVKGNLRVEGWLDARNVRCAGKGLYLTAATLRESRPRPETGWWALVGDRLPAELYVAYGGEWHSTGKSCGEPTVDASDALGGIPVTLGCASGAEESTLTLTTRDGTKIETALVSARTGRAGILTGTQFQKLYEAAVNAGNAIKWLNEFKTKTAEDFRDVYTRMNDYADGEDYSHFKQDTQDQIDSLRELHNQEIGLLDDKVKMAKRAVFNDQFLVAAGTWGKIDHTHVEEGVSKPYYLNELWLTYEEVVAVMDWGAITTYSTLARYKGAKIRTNLPPRVGATSDANTTSAFDLKYFDRGAEIEILNLACEPQVGNFGFVVNPQGAGSDFGLSGSKLRKVLGIVNLGKLTSFWTDLLSTPKLEEIMISHLRINISFAKCPRISAESIRYLIRERSGTNAITVTVHEEVYAKLTGDPNSPYLIELTVAELQEWMELVELAAERNITFACA